MIFMNKKTFKHAKGHFMECMQFTKLKNNFNDNGKA